MTGEEARRICGPELVAKLRRQAHEAGPFTPEQARLIARLLRLHEPDRQRKAA